EFDERDGNGAGGTIAFTGPDQKNPVRAVIINDRFARVFWPNDDPIGKRIKIGPPDANSWLTIVGVVKDVHNAHLNNPIGYTVYEPLAQGVSTSEDIIVRTTGDPAALIATAREELRHLESSVLVDHITTMDERIQESVSPQRLNLFLFGLFSALAL